MRAKQRNILEVGAAIVALIMVAGCTVSAEDGGPNYQNPDRPQFCTREYAPVCGVRASMRQTFGNACEARSMGYRIIGRGECNSQSRPGGGSGVSADRPTDPSAPGMCTQQYESVCARRGNSIRSFGNACEARNAGYNVTGEGRC